MLAVMFLWNIWRRQVQNGDRPWFCISTKRASDGQWRDHFIQWPDRARVRAILREFPTDKYHLYFCPNPLSTPKRLRDHVKGSAMLWSDLDAAHPDKCKYRPAVAWETSPGRYSCLWFLDRFYDAATVEQMNRQMTYSIGAADRSGWDTVQVLRIPETVNHKYPRRPVGKMMWFDESAKFDGVVEGPEDAASLYDRVKLKLKPTTRATLTQKRVDVGFRSQVLYKLQREMLTAGLTPDEVFILVRASKWNKFAGRRDEERQLRREISKALTEERDAPEHEEPRGELPSENGMLETIRASDIQEQRISWLWKPYIPRGMVSLIEGDPGLGKSVLVQVIAKTVVDGGQMINRERPVRGPVLYFTVEDDPSTVIKPRLIANECKNMVDFHIVDKMIELDEDGFEAVIHKCEEVRPVMIVFDPVMYYLGEADIHRANEVATRLARFKDLAQRMNAAVVLVRHLRKSNDGKALYRGIGSISFVGTVRAAMTVGKNPDDSDERVVAPYKYNVSKLPSSFTYTLQDTMNEQPRLIWGELVDISADDLGKEPKKSAVVDDATDWLRDYLQDGGVRVSRLIADAENRGYSDRVLKRAADKLGIVREGPNGRQMSVWSLPDRRSAGKSQRDPDSHETTTSDESPRPARMQHRKPARSK